MVAVAIAVTIFEYHFFVSNRSLCTMPNFEHFASLIFLAQTIVAILLRGARRLIGNFGFENTHFVMPIIALLLVGGVTGGIVGAAGACYLIAKLALASMTSPATPPGADSRGTARSRPAIRLWTATVF